VITAELLEVAVTGGGVVTSDPAAITCNPECTAWFETGTSVTLTAAPDSASTFSGWTGCPTATGPSCTLTMTGQASVTASFSLAPPGMPGGLTTERRPYVSLTLSWTAASNATGYDLERAPDAGGTAGTFALAASVSGTSRRRRPGSNTSPGTASAARTRPARRLRVVDHGGTPGSTERRTVSNVTADSVTVS
jgi:hypothetical protein